MTDLTRLHFYWAFEHSGNINQWETETIDEMYERLSQGTTVADFVRDKKHTLAGVTRLWDRMCERFPELIEQISQTKPKKYRLKEQVPTPADREILAKLDRFEQLEKFYQAFGIGSGLVHDLVIDDDEHKSYRLIRAYQFSQTVILELNKYVTNRRNTKLAKFMHENILKNPDLVIAKLCELANRDEEWGTNPENMVDF